MKQLYSYLKLSLLAVVCLLSVQVIAQTNGTISGTISTSDGKPASAVSIILKELNKSTITSDNGSFVLKNVKPGTYTLKTAYIGLQSQEKQVSVTAGEKASVEFVLAESAQKLSDVVVTGYKSVNQKTQIIGKAGIKPLDNPQMVTVISSAVIQDQQANRLSDVVKNVNGVAIGSARGGVAETFYARGYSLGANNIFKNGSRVSSGAIPEASTLESIEILKGSAALLYGNVSGGAVINLVTKQPKFDFGGEVSMRTGSYGLYKPTGDVYGPISKKLAYRLVGTYEDAQSFRNNIKSDRFYVNPSLLYKISSKTSILFQGDYLDYNNTPDFGIGSLDNNKLPTTISRSSSFNTPWAYNKAKQATASAVVNHELNSDWKINSTFSYQSYNRNYFSTERIQADADGDWGRKLSRSKTEEDYLNGQINLNGNFKTGSLKHTFLVGSDAERYDNLTNAFDVSTTVAYDSINILNPNKFAGLIRTDMPNSNILSNTKTPTYRFGYYVQDLVSISDKFKVLAGLRWTYQKIAVAKTYTVATDKEATTAPSKYDRAFSPRVGFVYQPIKTTSIFASYSNNFVSNSGTDVYGNVLRPSILDQYEVGIKNDFLNGMLSANLSFYKIYNDGQYIQAQFQKDGVTSNSVSTVKELAGETQSDGIELDLNGTIVDGLNFIAGYSYNYIRYTKSVGTKYSYTTNERLVGSTANTANASLFYTLKNVKLKGVKLGASAYYTGKRNGGWNNQPQVYSYSRLIPLKAYTTLDLSAGYTYRKVSFLGKFSNITNELNYVVHENYSVNPIAPRQFVTTVSYKF